MGRFIENCLKPAIFVFSRGDVSVTLSPAVVCSTSTSPLFSLLMEQLLLGHLGASMLLRHTPVHRANMKYSGIKTTSAFQSFCVKCLAFSWPSLIVFQGVIYLFFFSLKRRQCCLFISPPWVHSAFLLFPLIRCIDTDSNERLTLLILIP